MEKEIGKVTKYFSHIPAAVIEITADGLKIGDIVAIRGHTTKFEQEVESMRIDTDEISEASAGQVVGLQVKDRVRSGDKVYKLLPDE